jgi:hypothetical protein
MRHTRASQGQILALTFRKRFLKRWALSLFGSEVVWGLDCTDRRQVATLDPATPFRNLKPETRNSTIEALRPHPYARNPTPETQVACEFSTLPLAFGLQAFVWRIDTPRRSVMACQKRARRRVSLSGMIFSGRGLGSRC